MLELGLDKMMNERGPHGCGVLKERNCWLCFVLMKLLCVTCGLVKM